MNPSMWHLISVIALFAIPAWASDSSTSTNTYLTEVDKTRMKKILHVVYDFKDLSAAYYAAVGYQSLNEKIPRPAEICKFLIDSGNEAGVKLESIFYIASTWKILEICQPKSLNIPTLVKHLNSVLVKESPTILELYYAVNSLTAFGQKIPETSVTKVVDVLQAALKKDSSILNLAHTLHIAAELGSAGSFAFNYIDEVLVQADEVDGKYLQYEGGLSVTSHVVNGVYKLSLALKKKPEITIHQVTKFANYFLSRRSVQTPKGAGNFLSSINIIAKSPYEKPVCITLHDEGNFISAKQPQVKVKVCDIIGNPLSVMPTVIANTATKVGDDIVVISKKNFQSSPSDKTLFTLNFLEMKPEPGFYKITVSAGAAQNTVMIKVLTEVKVYTLNIGTADADQTTQPKFIQLEYLKKLSSIIEADSQQKLVLRFILYDVGKNKPMRVHQAFVRLSFDSTNERDKQEIIFVAEPDATSTYKFEMAVGASAKMFNYQSGNYNIELIIGDAVLTNSFQWTLGKINLKFPEPSSPEVVEKIASKYLSAYSPKPEIKHMFREPEKRPPAFVSNLFTGLCLSPLLILFILWAKLGVNISNFPAIPSAFLFHLGLGSIFVLYGIFWWQLNMFTTLRYLAILGIVTFLSGNKLLSYVAQKRKGNKA